MQNINYYTCPFQTIPTHPPIILPLDLTEINNLEDEVSKAIMVHGRIDILINNAGISYRGEVINTNVDVDIKVMLSNYFSQVALSKSKCIIYKNVDIDFVTDSLFTIDLQLFFHS